MKNLLLLLCLLVCLSSYSQERDINERYLPKKELKYSQKNVLSKPHISKKMLRGGGGDGGGGEGGGCGGGEGGGRDGGAEGGGCVGGEDGGGG